MDQPVGPSGRDVLLERDRELAAVTDALRGALVGRPRTVWIVAPAGLGKSRLLEAARAAAARSGLLVLSARCGELERDYPFGVAVQLFDPVLSGAEPRGAGPPGAQPPGAQPPGAPASPAPGSGPPGSGPPGSGPPGAQPTGAQPTGSGPPGAQPPGSGPPGAQSPGPPGPPASPPAAPAAAIARIRPIFDRSAGEPGAGAGVEFRLVHGLFRLTADLAERTPLLLAVDDAHWADEQSLRWLSYLVRRCARLPLAVVVTVRPGQPDAPGPLLDLLAGVDPATVLRPAPLTRGGAASALARWLPGPRPAGVDAACYRATRGNPFLLRELARALAELGRRGTPVTRGLVRTLAPGGVQASVGRGLAGMPEPARRFADALAVLGGSGDRHLVGALAGLRPGPAAAASDVLDAAGFTAGTRSCGFIHPMVRAVVYDGLSPGSRAAAHGRAARLLDRAGAPPRTVASHLWRSDPAGDPWVVCKLSEASGRALAKGAAATAVADLRRALAEPPTARLRVTVLDRLGRIEAQLGDPAAAGHLRAAFETDADPVRRVRTALVLVEFLTASGRLPEAQELLDGVRCGPGPAAAGTPRHELAARVELEAADLAMLRGRPIARPSPRPGGDTPIARPSPRPGGDTPGGRIAFARLTGVAVAARRPAVEVAALGRRAWSGGRLLAEQGPASAPLYHAATGLLYADRLDEAEALMTETISAARAAGSAAGLTRALSFRAGVLLTAGRLADAEADARDSLAVAAAHRLDPNVGFAPSHLARVLIERGELAEAGRVLDRALSTAPPAGWPGSVARAHRGLLLLARGGPGAALAELTTAGGQLAALGADHLIIPWRDWRALAMLAAGQRAPARALADETVRLARATHSRRAHGVALAVAGVVDGGPAGLDLLRRAVDTLAASPARLDHARAAVDLGALLRHLGRTAAARDWLRQGLDGAHRLGATALADRARAELVVAGGRPRRDARTGPDALTASERRIADLAARGLTNRQIAGSLFVATKTVEMHLGHAYRKLRIDSRAGLPDALRGGRPMSVGDGRIG